MRAGRLEQTTHEPLISSKMVEEVPLAGLCFTRGCQSSGNRSVGGHAEPLKKRQWEPSGR